MSEVEYVLGFIILALMGIVTLVRSVVRLKNNNVDGAIDSIILGVVIIFVIGLWVKVN